MRNLDYKKQFHGPRSYGGHASKNFVFRNECPGCCKILHRNTRNKVGYICKKCGPRFEHGRAEFSNICDMCPFLEECEARVALGIWVRCETPDIADLERLQATGGLCDETIRTEVDIALAGGGHRKVLEEALGKSAQEIYQGYSAGGAGQTAHRL